MSKKTRFRLKGWKESPSNPVRIYGEFFQPVNYRMETFEVEGDTDERMVCDLYVGDSKFDGRREYKNVHIAFVRSEWTDKVGVEVVGVGVDDS